MGVDRCSTPIFVDVTGLLSDSPLCNVTPPHRIPPKMDDHKQRGRRLIAKNSIFNLAGQVLPMAVGVLTIPYIVRGLGTAQYGILSIATMLLGYFNIFDLGLSRATVKFVAENLDPENLHKVPALIWTLLSHHSGSWQPFPRFPGFARTIGHVWRLGHGYQYHRPRFRVPRAFHDRIVAVRQYAYLLLRAL